MDAKSASIKQIRFLQSIERRLVNIEKSLGIESEPIVDLFGRPERITQPNKQPHKAKAAVNV